jgi:hypothetical protein
MVNVRDSFRPKDCGRGRGRASSCTRLRGCGIDRVRIWMIHERPKDAKGVVVRRSRGNRRSHTSLLAENT